MNPMFVKQLELEYKQDDVHRALRWAENERLANIARNAPAHPSSILTWILSKLRTAAQRPQPEQHVRGHRRYHHHRHA